MNFFKGKKQENISALFAVAGDVMMLHAADLPAAVASACFITACGVIYKYGHTAWGLSLGWFLYVLGNTAMTVSKISETNPPMHMAFMAYCALWTIGTSRFLLGATGVRLRRFKKTSDVKRRMIATGKKLVRVSAQAKPYLGLTAVILDATVLASSIIGNPHHVEIGMVGAGLCWITSDCLAGRVQKLYYKSVNFVKSFTPQ